MWAKARTESFFRTMRINWVVLFVFYFRDDALFPVWIWGWVCDEVNLRSWIWVGIKTMRLFQLSTASFRISLCKWISILDDSRMAWKCFVLGLHPIFNYALHMESARNATFRNDTVGGLWKQCEVDRLSGSLMTEPSQLEFRLWTIVGDKENLGWGWS